MLAVGHPAAAMTAPTPRRGGAGPASSTVSSPCIGLCRIDAIGGFCRGCARTGDEIGSWARSPDLRRRVWSELPARRAAIGLTMHRLALAPEDVGAFVAGTIDAAGGRWMPGAPADRGAFRVGGEDRPTLAETGDGLRVSGRDGAMFIRPADAIRALAFDGDTSAGTVVVLAITADRVEVRTAEVVRPLGRDIQALVPGGSSELLYDLGLGGPAGAHALRTGDPRTIEQLDRLAGRRWVDLAEAERWAVLGSAPTRVLRHPLGRFEAYGPIPVPNDVVATASLRSGLTAETGADPSRPLPDLPDGYVACAVHLSASGHTRARRPDLHVADDGTAEPAIDPGRITGGNGSRRDRSRTAGR